MRHADRVADLVRRHLTDAREHERGVRRGWRRADQRRVDVVVRPVAMGVHVGDAFMISPVRGSPCDPPNDQPRSFLFTHITAL